MLAQVLDGERARALGVADDQREITRPELIRGAPKPAGIAPKRRFQQQPACVLGTLRDQLELVIRQPSHVDRGYLATAEYLQRYARLGQQRPQLPDPLGQLAEIHLAHVGRGHDSPGTVRDGKAGELQCLAFVSRSVVDARQEMEVKLGSHPTFSTRGAQPSY